VDTRIEAMLPRPAQMKRMNRDQRIAAELEIATELGVPHGGVIPMADNFRSVETTFHETTQVGLQRPSAEVMRRNDDDVQPGSMSMVDPLGLGGWSQFAPQLLERQVLAYAERMDEQTLAAMVKQIAPQLNALGAFGKQARRIRSLQEDLSERAFGKRALAAMANKSSGGIET